MLSTHYLQEVEKSCTRVVIVHHGEIVADGTQEELVAEQPVGGLLVSARGPEDAVTAALRAALPEGAGVHVVARGDAAVDYRVATDAGPDDLEGAVAKAVVQGGWELRALRREQASLEDVFRELTLRAPEEVGRE